MGKEGIQWLASDDGLVVHVTIFTLLFLSGLGFPLPEDVPLLLGGAAAQREIVALKAIFITCYVGVIAGDQVMFFIGYYFGQRLLKIGKKSKFFPRVTQENIDKVREGLRKRRLMYIIVARHLFPIRSMTFLSAGSLHMPFLEFFFADAIAALISTSVMLALGYWLGGTLTPAMVNHLAHQANLYISLAVALIILGFVIRHVWKKRNKPQTNCTPNNIDCEKETTENIKKSSVN